MLSLKQRQTIRIAKDMLEKHQFPECLEQDWPDAEFAYGLLCKYGEEMGRTSLFTTDVEGMYGKQHMSDAALNTVAMIHAQTDQWQSVFYYKDQRHICINMYFVRWIVAFHEQHQNDEMTLAKLRRVLKNYLALIPKTDWDTLSMICNPTTFHWTCYTFYQRTLRYRYVDSMKPRVTDIPDGDDHQSLRKVMDLFRKAMNEEILGIDPDEPWIVYNFEVKKEFKQKNGYDCGVYAILRAMRMMGKEINPQKCQNFRNWFIWRTWVYYDEPKVGYGQAVETVIWIDEEDPDLPDAGNQEYRARIEQEQLEQALQLSLAESETVVEKEPEPVVEPVVAEKPAPPEPAPQPTSQPYVYGPLINKFKIPTTENPYFHWLEKIQILDQDLCEIQRIIHLGFLSEKFFLRYKNNPFTVDLNFFMFISPQQAKEWVQSERAEKYFSDPMSDQDFEKVIQFPARITAYNQFYMSAQQREVAWEAIVRTRNTPEYRAIFELRMQKWREMGNDCTEPPVDFVNLAPFAEPKDKDSGWTEVPFPSAKTTSESLPEPVSATTASEPTLEPQSVPESFDREGAIVDDIRFMQGLQADHSTQDLRPIAEENVDAATRVRKNKKKTRVKKITGQSYEEVLEEKQNAPHVFTMRSITEETIHADFVDTTPPSKNDTTPHSPVPVANDTSLSVPPSPGALPTNTSPSVTKNMSPDQDGNVTESEGEKDADMQAGTESEDSEDEAVLAAARAKRQTVSLQPQSPTRVRQPTAIAVKNREKEEKKKRQVKQSSGTEVPKQKRAKKGSTVPPPIKEAPEEVVPKVTSTHLYPMACNLLDAFEYALNMTRQASYVPQHLQKTCKDVIEMFCFINPKIVGFRKVLAKHGRALKDMGDMKTMDICHYVRNGIDVLMKHPCLRDDAPLSERWSKVRSPGFEPVQPWISYQDVHKIMDLVADPVKTSWERPHNTDALEDLISYTKARVEAMKRSEQVFYVEQNPLGEHKLNNQKGWVKLFNRVKDKKSTMRSLDLPLVRTIPMLSRKDPFRLWVILQILLDQYLKPFGYTKGSFLQVHIDPSKNHLAIFMNTQCMPMIYLKKLFPPPINDYLYDLFLRNRFGRTRNQPLDFLNVTVLRLLFLYVVGGSHTVHDQIVVAIPSDVLASLTEILFFYGIVNTDELLYPKTIINYLQRRDNWPRRLESCDHWVITGKQVNLNNVSVQMFLLYHGKMSLDHDYQSYIDNHKSICVIGKNQSVNQTFVKEAKEFFDTLSTYHVSKNIPLIPVEEVVESCVYSPQITVDPPVEEPTREEISDPLLARLSELLDSAEDVSEVDMECSDSPFTGPLFDGVVEQAKQTLGLDGLSSWY